MAVTTEYSDVATAQRSATQTVEADVWSSRVIAVTFSHTQQVVGDANSVIVLFRTPTGRSRFLSFQSWFRHSAWGTARLVSLGWLAYVDEYGATQAQNLTAIASALDLAASGTKHVGLNITGGQSFLFETPRWIAAQVTGGTVPVGATLSGTFELVLG